MLGDVTITLDGKPVVLKCTLGAAMVVDQNVGGVIAAFRAVSGGNITAMGAIIAAGSGMDEASAREAVFRTGVGDLIDGVTEFVGMLASGGRKPEPSKEPPSGNG